MSKRDEAYELFAQGKLIGDPEIWALGLEESTQNKYYHDWLKSQGPETEPEVVTEPGAEPAGEPAEEPAAEPAAEPAEEPTGEPVEVISLEPLQHFAFEGRIYSKRRVHGGGVNGVSIEGDKVIALPPDTLVTSVKPIEE